MQFFRRIDPILNEKAWYVVESIDLASRNKILDLNSSSFLEPCKRCRKPTRFLHVITHNVNKEVVQVCRRCAEKMLFEDDIDLGFEESKLEKEHERRIHFVKTEPWKRSIKGHL